MSKKSQHFSEPGARWLRCDLHVHTPFDGEKKFGEDIRAAIEAFRKEKPQRLAEIAERFVTACRSAAGGAGMDLVALTDHNSIDGYRYLRAQFDTLAQQARDQGLQMPAILPGVEFSVGGERPIHFLVIFETTTDPDAIDRAISHVFGTSDRFDPKRGTPRATGQSVDEFLTRLYEYCRPPSGDRNLQFVVLPAHADGRQGVSREVIGGAAVSEITVATSLWDEMKGHLRQRVITRRDWHGFQASRPFAELPQAFKELLWRWAAARRSEDWDNLSEGQKARYREQKHWALVECSDPHRYEAIGSRFTWLKMEVPDVEGIRLALLDPESRLRRMADGPPGRAYPRVQRLHVKRTDFFEGVEIPINPCLTTLIGGRGTGKSTVIEYLRHALDRARREDLPDDEPSNVREAVQSVLSAKRERDFGHTKGTLLPDHEITADIVVAERLYRVRRSASGIEVVQDPDQPGAQAAPFDVRSLVVPRILSQRQIARIARDPASQRSELDALIDPDRLREIENRRRALAETLSQLQATRTRLTEQGAKLPSVETELQKVRDQMAFIETAGRKEVLARFDALERERRWLDDTQREIERLASELEDTAGATEGTDVDIAVLPDSTPAATWVRSVADRVRRSRQAAATALRDQVRTLRVLRDTIVAEQAEKWQAGYNEARSAYDTLRQEMTARGVDFAQHEKLLQRRALLEREVTSLQKTGQELEEVARKLRETRLQLIERHESRLAARREQAQALEEMDADVRLEILGFRDRDDFESRREQWFGGAGLQERDWTALCDYIFAANGQVSDRIRELVEALRADVHATASRGTSLSTADSQVASLVGADRLTRNFFNALSRQDRIRLDEMERFLPEDLVQARVRAADGSFKTIETGSVGEKSTAILSLLLSAGDQPIIIDQPEDDLDNQYVYNVVVDLLRRRKFSRQVIIATHNANIPVNGDAELIVALGVKERLGVVLGAGSIDRPDIKELVSVIMEGSAEAFRLRRERYGY
jgi:ABC-type cobalamin/Fe3+-siderophores transport system ATPase subunit